MSHYLGDAVESVIMMPISGQTDEIGRLTHNQLPLWGWPKEERRKMTLTKLSKRQIANG